MKYYTLVNRMKYYTLDFTVLVFSVEFRPGVRGDWVLVAGWLGDRGASAAAQGRPNLGQLFIGRVARVCWLAGPGVVEVASGGRIRGSSDGLLDAWRVVKLVNLFNHQFSKPD